MLIEICATSIQSVINAEKAGAKRIELCAELAVGGITPSYGLIEQAVKAVNIPVFVLIRPRSGDFVYTEQEMEIMRTDIEQCQNLGCAGIVSGALTADFQIDLDQTKRLIEWSRPLQFTFHRAFDLTPDPIRSLGELIDLGANRVLTSGQANSALEGIELLKKLKDLAQSKMTILAGGGVNAENAKILKQNGFEEIHASASGLYKEMPQPKIPMNSAKFFDETKGYVSDLETIQKIVEA